MSFEEDYKRLPGGAYEIGGHTVTCPHCSSQDFEKGKAQLNTAAMSFFDLDWMNRSATVLTCRRCGHIEWFA